MSRMVLLWALVICCVSGWFYASAAEPKAPADIPATGQSEIPAGYALVMANGMTLKIAEYCIDLEKSTVYFKSELSGLSATFPLERIQRVVSFDARLAEVPHDAMPLFIPEKPLGSTTKTMAASRCSLKSTRQLLDRAVTVAIAVQAGRVLLQVEKTILPRNHREAAAAHEPVAVPFQEVPAEPQLRAAAVMIPNLLRIMRITFSMHCLEASNGTLRLVPRSFP